MKDKKHTVTTRLFFSGSGVAIENFLRKRPEEFANCGIMLSYFYQSDAAKTAPVDVRRLKKMIKGVAFTPKNKDSRSARLQL